MTRRFWATLGLWASFAILSVSMPLLSWATAEEPVSVPEASTHSENAANEAEAQTTKSSPPRQLTAWAWRLLHFQSMDDTIGTVRPKAPALYTMHLKKDGTVSMQLNCNRASGTWSAEPSGSGDSGRFEFGALATTRALCPPPSMDAKIAAHAKYIRSYLLKDGRLFLSLLADGGIYAWAPYRGNKMAGDVPAAPEDGGPRNWQVIAITGALNLRSQPTTGAKIISRFAAGTIFDNLGCKRAEGRFWCDVQPLGGGTRGYVAAAFLKPAVSPDGTVATGPDDSALRAGRGEFDATGKVPCAQSAGQPMAQCEFGVARAGGGYATVVVTKPEQGNRTIFFRLGRPIGVNTSEADGDLEFSATKEKDLNYIQVGNERYEIPDAVIFGG